MRSRPEESNATTVRSAGSLSPSNGTPVAVVPLTIDNAVKRTCTCSLCEKEPKIWLEIPLGCQYVSELAAHIQQLYHLKDIRLFYRDFYLPATAHISVFTSQHGGILRVMPPRFGSDDILTLKHFRQSQKQVSTHTDRRTEFHAMKILDFLCPEFYYTERWSMAVNAKEKEDKAENPEQGYTTPEKTPSRRVLTSKENTPQTGVSVNRKRKALALESSDSSSYDEMLLRFYDEVVASSPPKKPKNNRSSVDPPKDEADSAVKTNKPSLPHQKSRKSSVLKKNK